MRFRGIVLPTCRSSGAPSHRAGPQSARRAMVGRVVGRAASTRGARRRARPTTRAAGTRPGRRARHASPRCRTPRARRAGCPRAAGGPSRAKPPTPGGRRAAPPRTRPRRGTSPSTGPMAARTPDGRSCDRRCETDRTRPARRSQPARVVPIPVHRPDPPCRAGEPRPTNGNRVRRRAIGGHRCAGSTARPTRPTSRDPATSSSDTRSMLCHRSSRRSDTMRHAGAASRVLLADAEARSVPRRRRPGRRCSSRNARLAAPVAPHVLAAATACGARPHRVRGHLQDRLRHRLGVAARRQARRTARGARPARPRLWPRRACRTPAPRAARSPSPSSSEPCTSTSAAR